MRRATGFTCTISMHQSKHDKSNSASALSDMSASALLFSLSAPATFRLLPVIISTNTVNKVKHLVNF